MKNGIVLIN